MKQATSRILFALAVAAIPLSASADNAFTLRDVDVYTGPGSEYPPVATLPPNTSVNIAGCLSDWSWCDVDFADSRGWVYAADLGYPYQNNRVAIIEYGPRLGLPVVAFSLPAYWDAHYRGRPWYRERDVWVTRVHAQVDRGGRPPQGRAAVTTQPSGGAPAPQPSAGATAQPGQTQPGQTQPPQRPQAAQPPQAQSQSQSQTTPPSPQPGTRSQQTGPAPQTGQPPQSTQAPQASQSAKSARPPEGRPPESRPPEGRPPEGRPPEGRPPEGRPPEGRPSEGRPPESAGRPEAGSSSERGGQQEGKGPPEGRGTGGPDRDKQQ